MYRAPGIIERAYLGNDFAIFSPAAPAYIPFKLLRGPQTSSNIERATDDEVLAASCLNESNNKILRTIGEPWLIVLNFVVRSESDLLPLRTSFNDRNHRSTKYKTIACKHLTEIQSYTIHKSVCFIPGKLVHRRRHQALILQRTSGATGRTNDVD